MPADPITTGEWYQRLPAEFRDRVRFDPVTGHPTCVDVAAGAYTVTRELTNADRARCGLPPRTIRPEPRWPGDPPAP